MSSNKAGAGTLEVDGERIRVELNDNGLIVRTDWLEFARLAPGLESRGLISVEHGGPETYGHTDHRLTPIGYRWLEVELEG